MGKKIKHGKVFIAATRQNDGKTTVSLGLIHAFKKRYRRVGFIKPVGQRYVIEHGYKVDEDSILIEKVCGIRSHLKDMSPVAIERGFTERYIKSGNPEKLARDIKASFDRVAKNKELVVIEGTGHAGVGSVFDLSNAKVAKLLDAKVILVTSGGIGKPIDEIELNRALFEKEGVEVVGVIVNKVLPAKYSKIKRIMDLGFKRKGIDVLGVIPYAPLLSMPMIQNILEETDMELISKKAGMHNRVLNILVGAMEPRTALGYIENGTLLITPGDREDMLMTILSVNVLKKPKSRISISGIVLTGGIIPDKKIMALIENARIPVLLSRQHTYRAASQIHDLAIKINPVDRDKTRMAAKLVEQYVDIDALLKKISKKGGQICSA
ncbi:MAG: AAA family ATPase [Candidatus Omnitrophica bacterium]|nr:AAA family ATPase [Candidatus Omnitrophota bacterium]MBU4149477.1 AAA family ATPase [Candidatus Omnitrophota bacterium]